jgi:hypothetical protein
MGLFYCYVLCIVLPAYNTAFYVHYLYSYWRHVTNYNTNHPFVQKVPMEIYVLVYDWYRNVAIAAVHVPALSVFKSKRHYTLQEVWRNDWQFG